MARANAWATRQEDQCTLLPDQADMPITRPLAFGGRWLVCRLVACSLLVGIGTDLPAGCPSTGPAHTLALSWKISLSSLGNTPYDWSTEVGKQHLPCPVKGCVYIGWENGDPMCWGHKELFSSMSSNVPANQMDQEEAEFSQGPPTQSGSSCCV